MKKEEYIRINDVDEKAMLKDLEKTKEEFFKLAQKMIKADGKKIFPLDILAMGIIKRSLMIISGFSKLIREDNFLCAAPLIRLHLDNLLQFYATFIVSDPHDFSLKKLKGKQTNNLKDKDGEKMMDGYLVKKLSEEKNFDWVKSVYKETSKFIHFSDKHIFSCIEKPPTGNTFTTLLSEKMEVPKFAKIEVISGMLKITYGLFKYLYSWIHTKNNPQLC